MRHHDRGHHVVSACPAALRPSTTFRPVHPHDDPVPVFTGSLRRQVSS
jgi:hypothetical protein